MIQPALKIILAPLSSNKLQVGLCALFLFSLFLLQVFSKLQSSYYHYSFSSTLQSNKILVQSSPMSCPEEHIDPIHHILHHRQTSQDSEMKAMLKTVLKNLILFITAPNTESKPLAVLTTVLRTLNLFISASNTIQKKTY